MQTGDDQFFIIFLFQLQSVFCEAEIGDDSAPSQCRKP
jgi:hypothetical protein